MANLHTNMHDEPETMQRWSLRLSQNDLKVTDDVVDKLGGLSNRSEILRRAARYGLRAFHKNTDLVKQRINLPEIS